ncbi:hypothetical protein ALP84_200019 [Pseudomonas cichorii]|uniref:Uncharacterized protein n=1 Tax=Pseudomonas cichorii TaxID=36746 RepID=A0A3M4VZZ4_PSECI|nr:hypothetical protein ALP84_200019 [Pseudomonas cichorii]
MMMQIFRMFRRTESLKVIRRANDCPGYIGRESLSDHVFGNRPTETNASIMTVADNIDHFIGHGQVDLDIRIAINKNREHGAQQQFCAVAQDIQADTVAADRKLTQ